MADFFLDHRKLADTLKIERWSWGEITDDRFYPRSDSALAALVISCPIRAQSHGIEWSSIG